MTGSSVNDVRCEALLASELQWPDALAPDELAKGSAG